MWIAAGLDGVANVKGISIVGAPLGHIDIEISVDKKNWKKVIRSHYPRKKDILFPKAEKLRYFRITITNPRRELDWRLGELNIIIDK